MPEVSTDSIYSPAHQLPKEFSAEPDFETPGWHERDMKPALSDLCAVIGLMTSLRSLELTVRFGVREDETVDAKFEAILAVLLRPVVEKRILTLKKLAVNVNFLRNPSQQPGIIEVRAVIARHTLKQLDVHCTQSRSAVPRTNFLRDHA